MMSTIDRIKLNWFKKGVKDFLNSFYGLRTFWMGKYCVR